MHRKLSSPDTLLLIDDLNKVFLDTNKLWHNRYFSAVCNITFPLEKGKTIAIIGENGAGKSTLVKMIAGLIKPSSGNIYFKGSLLAFGDYQTRCKHIRMVPQDSDASLIPHFSIKQTLDIPLTLNTNWDEQQREKKIRQTLELVGMTHTNIHEKIFNLSLSQKQRITIARAIILEPEILILDNALTAMDASVQSQMINILLNLQKHLGTAYICLGQHIGIIKHIADDILVMKDGHMIEYGGTQEVLSHPSTELTRRLVESYFRHALDSNDWVK